MNYARLLKGLFYRGAESEIRFICVVVKLKKKNKFFELSLENGLNCILRSNKNQGQNIEYKFKYMFSRERQNLISHACKRGKKSQRGCFLQIFYYLARK